MRTKMDLNVEAEDEEEKKIEAFLGLLHNSSEVQQFLNTMREEATRRKVFKYRDRIKDVKSAIRTYRINHKKLEDAHDYIGISFITDNEKEIYPIVDYLKEKLPNSDFVDFVSEEMIYSPLVYIKWVPPLGYNILSKVTLIPKQREIPVEIRVCSKEAYISEQAAYYSVQKNDTIKMPMEEKNNLRNLVQHITYKLALLCMRDFTKLEKQKQEQELDSIINCNAQFLNENKELCKDAILDLGKLIYRCENNCEMEKDEVNLMQDNIDDIDDYLKKTFDNFLKTNNGNNINTICEAVKNMRLIAYKKIKEELSI